jgi:hypothetical protein
MLVSIMHVMSLIFRECIFLRKSKMDLTNIFISTLMKFKKKSTMFSMRKPTFFNNMEYLPNHLQVCVYSF